MILDSTAVVMSFFQSFKIELYRRGADESPSNRFQIRSVVYMTRKVVLTKVLGLVRKD